MKPLLNVDSALKNILAAVRPLPSESISLAETLDRVIARDIVSPVDLPPFDNSAMDGYAIRHQDSAAANAANPVALSVVMDIPAGAAPTGVLETGQAARIMTGAPIPPGTSAVIPVEDTDDDWYKGEAAPVPATVRLFRALRADENIRRAGESIAAGHRIMAAGTALGPAEIGMLAGIGCAKVDVIRQPKVVILSSGDELVDVHQTPAPGQIRDSNSYSVAALVRAGGGVAIRLPIARDSLDSVRALYRRALEIHPDLIISTAGVSVGAADFVKTVLDELGDIDFWRINMRPGKPLAFGSLQGIPFFGLPGNPVSAMVTFEVLARPALARISGREFKRKTISAVTADALKSDGRRSYIRVTISRSDKGFIAHSTGIQSSGALMSMVLADGLAVVPEGTEFLPAGTELTVLLLRSLD